MIQINVFYSFIVTLFPLYESERISVLKHYNK